jgi:hypothetical protein
MQLAQVDAGDRSHGAGARDRARESMGRDGDAHASLHDRQEAASPQVQVGGAVVSCMNPQGYVLPCGRI